MKEIKILLTGTNTRYREILDEITSIAMFLSGIQEYDDDATQRAVIIDVVSTAIHDLVEVLQALMEEPIQ